MVKEVRLPEVSENVESGVVTEVLVSKGDTVEVDQPIIELETDKAVLEVPSSEAGTVTEVLVKPDQEIKIGEVIIKVDTEGTQKKTEKKEEKKPAEETPSGKETEPEEKEPEPTKKREKEEAEPEEEPEGEEEETEAAAKSEEPARPKYEPPKISEPVPASPSVRRLAREIGVDIQQVTGTGPGGRISEDDVKAHAKQIVTRGGAAVPQRKLPDFSKWGEVEREPFSTIRRITAENVAYSWSTIPHVTQFDEADITEVEEFRKQYGSKVEEAGGKLTVTAILLKVLAAGLKAFPRFNSSLDMNAQEIIYKKYYHIAVAVDTNHGLIMPVIRDIDKKNLIDLSLELGDIAMRARKKKITPDELEGGTFTISNQGAIGGTNFTPIIFPPQVGVSRAAMRQVRTDEGFKPRLILPLSLSYDHRANDGADAARFLGWIVKALEEPLLITLEG
ncbi:MAG: 2-oxo acid dehydrogenase subunit E2 [Candidatus Zixiibacteriota bacterium]|jgi:pyruvate dehydrogenase E2 component (dihydrolipoamide acetyltransferase)